MGGSRLLFNVGRNYAFSSLHVRRVGLVTGVSLSNCTVNKLTINRPGRSVCEVVDTMAPFTPCGGPECLVNINAPKGVVRKMDEKMSLFSYIVPDQGTQRNRLFAGGKVVGVGGTGCTESRTPVSRRYGYPIYGDRDEKCMHRLLGTNRVLNVHLTIVRGLCFCGGLLTRVEFGVRGKDFRSCGGRCAMGLSAQVWGGPYVFICLSVWCGYCCF